MYDFFLLVPILICLAAVVFNEIIDFFRMFCYDSGSNFPSPTSPSGFSRNELFRLEKTRRGRSELFGIKARNFGSDSV